MLLHKSVTLLLFQEQVRDYTSCKPGSWYANVVLGTMTYLQSVYREPNFSWDTKASRCKVPYAHSETDTLSRSQASS